MTRITDYALAVALGLSAMISTAAFAGPGASQSSNSQMSPPYQTQGPGAYAEDRAGTQPLSPEILAYQGQPPQGYQGTNAQQYAPSTLQRVQNQETPGPYDSPYMYRDE